MTTITNTKPEITKSNYPAGYSLGSELFTYYIDYGTGWSYSYTMTEEGFYMLCKTTGWELS
jgi:hypothetical protein